MSDFAMLNACRLSIEETLSQGKGYTMVNDDKRIVSKFGTFCNTVRSYFFLEISKAILTYDGNRDAIRNPR